MSPVEVAMQVLKQLWAGGFKRLAIIGVSAFGIATALLLWANGYTVKSLDRMLTKEDLQATADTIAASNQEAADQVTDALAAYDVNLKGYLRQERKLAVDTTLKPLVKMMFAMSKQIEDLQTLQRTTQSQVRQLPAAYEAGLRNIIEEKPPSRTDALLEELVRANAEQQAFNARMDSLIRAKRKTNKVGL